MNLDALWKSRAVARSPADLRPRGSGLLSLAGLALLFLLGLIVAVAPWAVILLGIALLAVSGTFAVAAFATAGAPLWIRLCAAVVLGQLVLNYGFSTIVVPLGPAPLPLSELVLVVALLACVHQVFLASDPVRLPPMIWIPCLWATLNLALHLPSGFDKHGFAAARDALPTLEVLFLLPGFVAANVLMRQPDGGTRFFQRSVGVLVMAVAVYGLGYSIQDQLLRYSPRLPSIQQSVPVLGSFHSWPMIGLFAMLAFTLWRWQTRSPMTLGGWFMGVVIFTSGAYTFFAVQSRAAYLIAAFFLLILLLLGGQARRVLLIFSAIVVASLGLLLLETLGLELKGRVSNLSSSQIFDHLMTLSGDAPVAEFQGAAAGIGQRRAWIEHSLGLWQRDAGSMVFGIGFGDVLTDHTVVGFQGQTILVREPHNSYVSILTRSGAIGLLINLVMHGTMLLACIALYRRSFQTQRVFASMALGVMFIHVFCLLTALGQPVLESPNVAVPLHFLLGAIYAVYRRPARESPGRAVGGPLPGHAAGDRP